MSFLQQLVENYGAQISSALAQNLDIPPSDASDMLPKVAPLILGGLAAKAQKDGAQSVESLIEEHGDPGALEDLGQTMQKGQENSQDVLKSLMGSGMAGLLGGGLGGLLSGGRGGGLIGQILGQRLGIDGEKAMKAVSMLAPVILGALAKKKGESGGGMDAILKILDEDGDGNAINDLASKFLGGGGLGGALTGLFDGKK